MLMLSEHDASLYGKTNSLHRMIKKTIKEKERAAKPTIIRIQSKVSM